MSINKILTVLSLFVLLGCSASKPLLLEMNLVEGKEFNFESNTNTVSSVNVMGSDQKTLANQSTEAVYKVINVSSDGKYKVKSTITNLASDQSNAMSNTTYNSRKPGQGDATLEKMMNPMIGHEMMMVLNKQGAVVSFEQADIIEEMFEGADENMMQVKPMMEQQFGEEGMKQMMSSFTGILPDKPVKKGESWSKQMKIKTTLSLVVDMTYTLNERKNGKAYISAVGTTKTDPEADPINLMGMKMTYELQGPITGNMVVDEKTGWTVDSKINQVMKGKMNITGEMIGNMVSDMEVTTTASTKMIEKGAL